MTSLISFLSLNVGGSTNLAGLNMTLNLMSFDVIFVQEIKSSQLQLDALVQKLGFSSLVNIDTNDSEKPGTALIWKNSIPLTGAVNLVSCRLQMAENMNYRIFNCYAPSGSGNKFARNQFYGEIVFKYLRSFSGSINLLAGAHNSVLRREDVEDGFGFSRKFCESLNSLVKCEHLVDCFLHLKRPLSFTFHRPGKAKSRLDRFYISEEVSNDIVSIEHLPSVSDHLGVRLILRVNISMMKVKNVKNYCFWKLNNQILEDDEFLPSFTLLWQHLSKQVGEYGDIADWWDLYVKPSIKDFCIGFSSYRKDKRNQTKQLLMATLKIMMEENNWEEVIRIRETLNKMLMEDLTGYKVRSRFQNGPESERSSIFHAAKELKNYKNVNSGLKINGTVITDKSRIEEEIILFFNALFNGHHGLDLKDTGLPFSPDWTNLDALLEGVGKISDLDKEHLVSDINKEELDFIVKSCPTMKSPGLDGLTYEFYKKVWHIIGNQFVEVLQIQLSRLRLIESNMMGATKLVPKVDCTPSVDELRPITLLNTDYKLLTKWIVLRLKPLMGDLIKSGQICNVDKKNILFGVQNILSSIDYVKQKKLGAALVSLDFFKAYDRLYLPFLLKVLEKMNLGGTFSDWVRMLHHGAKTKFILSFLTRCIEVSFSVRQDDPLAISHAVVCYLCRAFSSSIREKIEWVSFLEAKAF